MKIWLKLLTTSAIVVAICILFVTVNAQVQVEATAKVTLCQLKNDPNKYNHKLVEVTAFISHGFEDFTLFDLECTSKQSIWLEYGGKRSSDTTYCCGVTPSRTRPKQLVVEGIPIPLVIDVSFQKLDDLFHRRPDSSVHATIVGRFFSGKQQTFPGGTYWVGYGHMGFSSLLAIQQVKSVDSQDRKDLDYGASVDQPNINKAGCSFKILAMMRLKKT